MQNLAAPSIQTTKPAEDTYKFHSEHEAIESIVTRISTVAILGGAGWEENSQVYMDAFETAKILARNGYKVMNGGGPGVMKAATLGALAGGQEYLTAVTYHINYPHKNYEGTDPTNTFDNEIMTTDYFDRTKVMLENTELHIVFKGGTGTVSEFGMTWASSRIHEGHHKHIILFGDFWHEIVDVISKNMLIRPGELNLLTYCNNPQEVLAHIKKIESP